MVAVPPTLILSPWPAALTSTWYVLPAPCTRLPLTLRVPIELPGASVPALTTRPATLPLPPRVPPFIVTPLARLPLTTRLPALTVVPPV